MLICRGYYRVIGNAITPKMPAMTVSSPQRKFTAEIRKNGFFPSTDVPGERAGRSEQIALWHREILDAIADVRERIAEIAPGECARPVIAMMGAVAPSAPEPGRDEAADAVPAAPEEPDSLAITTDELQRLSEFRELRGEVQALEQAIAQTRREIAALRQVGKPPATLSTATDELDAVVQATEAATECILNASERIDQMIGTLRNQAAGEDERAVVEEIGEQVTKIFEACNFQDITGQRLNKVVNTMKFIEARVERMMQILGGEQVFEELEPEAPPPPEHGAPDEAHLLCGPQLAQNKISQDDIDAFFN